MSDESKQADAATPAQKTAAPKKAAPKKAAPKKAAPKKSGIDGIFVKTKPGLASFRRAGFGFNREGSGIALDALSETQLELLEEEENIIVEYCTFSDDDTFIKAGK